MKSIVEETGAVLVAGRLRAASEKEARRALGQLTREDGSVRAGTAEEQRLARLWLIENIANG